MTCYNNLQSLRFRKEYACGRIIGVQCTYLIIPGNTRWPETFLCGARTGHGRHSARSRIRMTGAAAQRTAIMEVNMNIQALFKLKSAWDTFSGNHPKFPAFLNTVARQGIEEGTVIAFSVTRPDGEVLESNLKLTASDLELFQSLKDLT